MTTRPPAEIGMSLDEVDTPALIVDLDAFERNLRRLADRVQGTDVRLRPHAKTHKCPVIALKQIELGAVGVCCQKVSEAEAMVYGGVKDVLVTNEILARQIGDAPHLSFAGLQAYHGSAQHLRTWQERQQAIKSATDKAALTRDLLAANGIACDNITGAGTGTFEFEAGSGVYTELQCGSYIFMDADYGKNLDPNGKPTRAFEPSLFVWATVMSRPTEDRAIVDAGLK